MTKKILFAFLAAIFLLLLWIVFGWDDPGQQGHSRIDIAQAPQGGDFVLQSVHGPLSLESQRGKVVVLYFGYTMCPDVCPTSLSLLSSAFSKLEPDELNQVQGIFVSVDPGRDTLEHLDVYGRYFHDNIQGVTGTPDEVADVARMYGAVYRQVESDSAVGYIVDHSAYTYLIDRKGKLRESLSHGTMPDVIVNKIRGLLSERPNM